MFIARTYPTFRTPLGVPCFVHFSRANSYGPIDAQFVPG
jgi:hypothetical protein